MILEQNNLHRMLQGRYIQVSSNVNTSRFSYPVHSAEVDSFSEVEALIESTVVSSGESDDELSCTLVGAIDLWKKKISQV